MIEPDLQKQLEEKIEQLAAMKCYLLAVEAGQDRAAEEIAKRFNLNT